MAGTLVPVKNAAVLLPNQLLMDDKLYGAEVSPWMSGGRAGRHSWFLRCSALYRRAASSSSIARSKGKVV